MGSFSWEMIYESLDNALYEKDEKFKTTRLKNPDHNIEKYNLYGFTSGVQVRCFFCLLISFIVLNI